MNNIEKKYFKYYVYDTISAYHVFNNLYLPKGEVYKRFKIKRVFDYIGIKVKPNKSLLNTLLFLSVLEIPISHFIELYYFIKCIYAKMVSNKEDIDKQIVLYGRGAFIEFSLFKKSHIDINEVDVIVSPLNDNKMYESCNRKSLMTFVNYSELVKALLLSFRVSCFLPRKYGYRDCYFRSYSSFPFFIVCYAFNHIDKDKTVLFTSLNDRWAYLFGHVMNKKLFIQHGALSANFRNVGRIGTADVGYYFNEEQRDICNRKLFNNVPECRYMETMTFTGNEKIANNGNLNLLLICYQHYFANEKMVISELSKNRRINIYIKPHPTDNERGKYIELNRLYAFTILDKKDYPKVDYVISYNSTLALEYKMAGVKTLLYEDTSFNDEFEKIKCYFKD